MANGQRTLQGTASRPVGAAGWPEEGKAGSSSFQDHAASADGMESRDATRACRHWRVARAMAACAHLLDIFFMGDEMKKTLSIFLILCAPLAFAGELTQDSELVQTCGSCHGVDGNSVLPVAPNLAGQLPGYLLYELNSYKTHNRVDDFMGDIIDPLSEADIHNLVAYYAKQKFVPSPPDEPLDPALIAKGKLLYHKEITSVGLSCADCHGPQAEGEDNRQLMKDFPRLAGQKHDYLVSTLKEYAGRMKHFSLLGMKVVAASLSDDEIKALAAYLSSLQ
jgi:cytochrome c553